MTAPERPEPIELAECSDEPKLTAEEWEAVAAFAEAEEGE